MVGQGITTGEMTGDRHYTGNVSFAQGTSGAGFNFVKKGTQIWHVDSGKQNPAASGNGLTWEGAFLTLQEAVTAAGDYDTILVAHNSIETIAATGIAITQDGLRIFGPNGSPGRQSAAFKSTGTAPMFVITGDRVEIAGLHFSQRGAYICIQVGSASDGGVYQTWIHHCNLEGYGTATYGVSGYAQTADTVHLVVEDCHFQGFATAAIHSNGTGDSYKRNVIKVNSNTIGIDVKKTGGTRGEGVIADNLIYGVAGGSTVGIKLAGNITAGLFIIANNLLSGSFDTTITQSTGLNGVQNFISSSTGGSLIDTSS